jgi:glutathione synthase
MKIAFLIDRLDSINPLMDTTSHLMYECNQRGHTVFFMEPHDIYIRRNQVVARMHHITVPRSLSMKRYWRSFILCTRRDEFIYEAISELDVLFLSHNPPLLSQAMETMALQSDRILIINSTIGLILGSSKLYILNFPDIIPETHVSRDPVRLKKIIDDFGGTMLMKPMERYGGEGVIKVSVEDRENLNSLIHYYVKAYRDYPDREPIMVQEYLDTAQGEGNIRVLLLNGEIIGALRMKPRDGDFQTGFSTGAKLFRHEITANEREICESIKDKLMEDGLIFVGIDIIANKLIGIECANPRGIPQINRLDNVKVEKRVIDFVEKKKS